MLFDEVEKAHPDVFNMMLQMLDDGRLTDSRGRTVSFANALIVMTSNIGSRQVERGVTGGGALGFDAPDGEGTEGGRSASYARLRGLVQEELKGAFRPEFLNRVDEVVVFEALSRDSVGRIAEVELPKVLNRLTSRGITVSLTDAFRQRVVSEGFDPAYGARPLRRAIARLLEDPLAEHLLLMERDGRPGAGAPEPGAPTGAPTSLVVDVVADGSVLVSERREQAQSVVEAQGC